MSHDPGTTWPVWPLGPLHAALFPVVIERVRLAGERVVRMRRALDGDAGGPSGEAAAALDDAEPLDEGRALGWVVGGLAAASGGDVLFERRDPEGARLLLDLVRELLAAEGRPLAEPSALPRELAAEDAGWAPAWAIANLLYLASGPPEACWSLERPARGLVLTWRGPTRSGVRELAAQATRAVPRLAFAPLDEGWVLTYSNASESAP